MANRASGEDGHIGGARANIDQGHTQLFFIGCQHRIARGQGVEHQLLDIQSTAAHAFDDVFGGALGTGDDVHLGLQADAAHANRLFHVLAVDDKLLRLDQQQALVGGDVDRLGSLHHPGHIGGGDLAVLDRHHAAGIHATDVAAGDAGVDLGDFAIGHEFGFFQRGLDALHRGVDVDHHTTLEAVAGRDPHASDLQLSAGQDLGHHGHHLAGANVQAHHEIFVFFCHVNSLSYLLRPWFSSVLTPRKRSAYPLSWRKSADSMALTRRP